MRNLFILILTYWSFDHSWLNEIDIHTTVRRSLAGLRIKSINLEISKVIRRLKLELYDRSKVFSPNVAQKKSSKPTRRDRAADCEFYELFIYVFSDLQKRKTKVYCIQNNIKKVGVCLCAFEQMNFIGIWQRSANNLVH